MSVRARAGLGLGAFFLATSLSFAAAPADTDAVGGLIDSEKAAYDEWLSPADDPPQAYLPGDLRSVELYSPAHAEGSGGLVCSGLDLAELVVATGGDPSARETPINFSLPRVRLMFGDACLIRPGDRIVAVEAGRNEERTLGRFVVRRERAVVRDGDPFALYALLSRPAQSDPLFYALDPSLTEADTTFSGAATLPTCALPPAAVALLPKLSPFPEDFQVVAFPIPGSSTGTLVILTRRQASTEDDRLPAMILAVFDGAAFQALWTERIDLAHGSGRFALVGISDFNLNGRPEIIVDGIHRQCPYRVIFELESSGWAQLPLPVKVCGG